MVFVATFQLARVSRHPLLLLYALHDNGGAAKGGPLVTVPRPPRLSAAASSVEDEPIN